MASTTNNNNLTRNSIQKIGNNGSNIASSIQSSTNSLSSNSSDTIDGLPKSFINAMRTLFDIMADPRTGYVKFSEIEQRWQEGTQGMPMGVVESLRKVTPPNGLLSFDRFCSGLKICLIQNQPLEKPSVLYKTRQVIGESNVSPTLVQSKESRRPPSAPALDLNSHLQKPAWNSVSTTIHSTTNTATVRPNNVQISAQRTISMPQLSPERVNENPPMQTQTQIHNIYSLGPPKPPRAMRLSAPAVPDRLDKAEIRNALHHWQLNVLEGDKNKTQQQRHSQGSPNSLTRSSGDGQTDILSASQATCGIYQKKANIRRREPRRHTLQNGIDYSMLKRLKQIEQEKDVLLEGLSCVEKARDWYLKQISVVQDKIKYLGRAGTHMVSRLFFY